MSVSETYKTRLSEIVKNEVKRLRLLGISERNLAGKIGVSWTSVQRWRKCEIKRGLSEEALVSLAGYLAKTPPAKYHHLNSPEQLAAFLAGVDEAAGEPALENSALVWQRLQALELKVSRLEDRGLNDQGDGRATARSVLTYLIEDTLQAEELSHPVFAQRAALAVNRLHEIMAGAEPTAGEYEGLTKALNYSGESNWSARNLKQLFDNQRKPKRLEESSLNGARV